VPVSTFDDVPRSTKIRGTATTPQSIPPRLTNTWNMEHVEQEVLRCFVGVSSFHAMERPIRRPESLRQSMMTGKPKEGRKHELGCGE